MVLPMAVFGGSLRVGPTRIDLSAQRPIAVLEVQNSGDSRTLAQIDLFDWSQDGKGDVYTPTTDVIATPIVLNLAPNETKVIRIGLRAPNHTDAEHAYRLFVREIPSSFDAGMGLQFAVRVGVPVFAEPARTRTTAVNTAAELSWRWVPDIEGCESVQLSNPTIHHDRVLIAEMLNHAGEVLWRAGEPAYVLAWSHRTLLPNLCPPSIKEATTLRLRLESGGALDLPVVAPSLVVEANTPAAR